MTTLVIRQPSLLDEFEGIVDGHYMRLDVHGIGDELVVKAELPGVGKDGFGITIEGRSFT